MAAGGAPRCDIETGLPEDEVVLLFDETLCKRNLGLKLIALPSVWEPAVAPPGARSAVEWVRSGRQTLTGAYGAIIAVGFDDPRGGRTVARLFTPNPMFVNGKVQGAKAIHNQMKRVAAAVTGRDSGATVRHHEDARPEDPRARPRPPARTSSPRPFSTDPAELAQSGEFDVDHGLPDERWMGESRSAANAVAANIADGSPERSAEAAKVLYDRQGFGAAAALYCKAIDQIHTQYLVHDMRHRQPSPADAWIVHGFVSAVGASLAMHPGAPIDEEVREGTHRLRTIWSMCERVGAPSALYGNALQQLAIDAPDVRVDDILW